MQDLISLAIWIGFFVFSYFIGTYREKAHHADIVKREKALVSLPAVTMKRTEDLAVVKSKLVMGNVVIGADFFKQVAASLASLFGMRISVVEGMMDRARREAVLRMKDHAVGADAIINVRVESMKIGDRKKLT
ncbi:MAG: heavy metal-binding domain-containing protein, partial [Deltaproteobacteria bacterium]|nr:heavy metal-binding domain-containing protein [Deltaproteobacteria bacterium]